MGKVLQRKLEIHRNTWEILGIGQDWPQSCRASTPRAAASAAWNQLPAKLEDLAACRINQNRLNEFKWEMWRNHGNIQKLKNGKFCKHTEIYRNQKRTESSFLKRNRKLLELKKTLPSEERCVSDDMTSPHFWWHFTILAEQREDSCSTDVRRSPKRSASRSWLLASNLQKEWRKERRDSRKSVSNKTFWQAMKNLSLRFTRNMWIPFTSPSVQGGGPALSLSPQSCPRAALVPASSGCSSQQFGPDESDGPGYQGGTLESVRN